MKRATKRHGWKVAGVYNVNDGRQNTMSTPERRADVDAEALASFIATIAVEQAVTA